MYMYSRLKTVNNILKLFVIFSLRFATAAEANTLRYIDFVTMNTKNV